MAPPVGSLVFSFISVLFCAPEAPRVISGRLYYGRVAPCKGSRRSDYEDRGGTDGRPGRSKWQRQVDYLSPVASPLRLHGWTGE